MRNPSDRARRVVGVIALMGCVAVSAASAAPSRSTEAGRSTEARLRDRDRDTPSTMIERARRLVLRALQEITIPKP